MNTPKVSIRLAPPAKDLAKIRVQPSEFVSVMNNGLPVVLGLYDPRPEVDEGRSGFVIASMALVMDETPTVLLTIFESKDFALLAKGLEGECKTFCWHSDHVTALENQTGMNFGGDSIHDYLLKRFREKMPAFRVDFLNPLGTARNCGLVFNKFSENESLEEKLNRMVVYAIITVASEAVFTFRKVTKTLNLQGLFRDKSLWSFTLDKVRIG